MQAFFSCFSCGQKTSSVVNPQPIPISSSKIQENSEKNQKNNISLIQSFDDQKSKTATTITFRTTDTAPSKIQDDEQYILNKVEQIKKKDLAQKKALEQQFIRQNLTKSKTIYLVEKQWSEQYTKFLKDPKIKSIRAINNRNLFDSKGKLRSDIKQKQDYFIINEKIWKFVQSLYGGGPDIARDWFFPVYTITYKKLQILPSGITNPLNLCYMISILQCLFSIQPLNYYFFKKQYSQSQDTKKKLVHNSLYKFTKQLIDDNGKSQDIKQFASIFQSKFNPYEQHDAQQFFLHLSNLIQQQMKIDFNVPKSFKDPQTAYYFYMTQNRSIIDKVFAGQITSTITCNKCGEDSHSYLPFIDICLQLTDSNLEGCFKRHFDSQKLQDLYDCQICKKKSKAVKKLTITKTSNYLMVVLKKFTPSGKKIEDRIKYPYELQLSKFSSGHCGQTKFSLLSVIIHKGSKSTKGHYYCYTRRNKKDWFYCNDDEIRSTELTEALGRDAYILFYQRIK